MQMCKQEGAEKYFSLLSAKHTACINPSMHLKVICLLLTEISAASAVSRLVRVYKDLPLQHFAFWVIHGQMGKSSQNRCSDLLVS